MGLVHHGLDLFNYDQRVCSSQVLIPKDGTPSNIEYDEYVVYKKPEELESGVQKDAPGEGEEHIVHHFTRDDASGTTLFDLAFRHGFLLDRNVCFFKQELSDPVTDLLGRVPQARRHGISLGPDGRPDPQSVRPRYTVFR